MSQTLNAAIAVVGIDIGKNFFHIVGHDERGAIVLHRKWSRGQVEARFANIPPCLASLYRKRSDNGAFRGPATGDSLQLFKLILGNQRRHAMGDDRNRGDDRRTTKERRSGKEYALGRRKATNW